MQWLSLGLGFVQQNTSAVAWFGFGGCTAEHQCSGLVWVWGLYSRTPVQWLNLGLFSRTPVQWLSLGLGFVQQNTSAMA